MISGPLLCVVKKMKEDAKMLSADLSGMSTVVRPWHVVKQQRILREMGIVPPETTTEAMAETTPEAMTETTPEATEETSTI